MVSSKPYIVVLSLLLFAGAFGCGKKSLSPSERALRDEVAGQIQKLGGGPSAMKGSTGDQS